VIATKPDTFDAIVVGSGAGGGFAAMSLAEAGMRVLLLERGRRFDPRRDFPMNHPDWELRPRAFRDTEAPPGDVSLVREEGAPLDPRYAHLRSSSLPGEVLKSGSRRAPFRYDRVLGLGGTTLHYQGEAHRFPDHAFRPASLYGLGVDWPLSYADLAPYYDRVEHLLGVAGDPANPFKPPRGPFPTPAHRLSYASQRIATGAAKLGWSLLPNSLALPTRSTDGRPPCQRSGGCVHGCIFGAKSSVDLTAIRRAEGTGRLQVQTESRVFEIEMGPGRHPQSTAVFLYFLGPEGFTYEYSWGVRRIEDDSWRPRTFDPDEPGSIDMWLGPTRRVSTQPQVLTDPIEHREVAN